MSNECVKKLLLYVFVNYVSWYVLINILFSLLDKNSIIINDLILFGGSEVQTFSNYTLLPDFWLYAMQKIEGVSTETTYFHFDGQV